MRRKFLSLDRAVSEPLAADIKLDRILTGGEPLGRGLSWQMRDFLPKDRPRRHLRPDPDLQFGFFF